MIEQLFGSKTRVKLLHLFYSNPNRSFYVREITRKIDEQINSVRRELSNLLSIGIIKSDSSGNKLYYEVNQEYEHHEALRAIFSDIQPKGKEQVASATGDLGQRFRAIGSVKLAFLSGNLVRESHLPVDVFIVGDVNRVKLGHLIEELEAEEGKELRYAVFSPEDFEYRRNLNDRFVTQMLNAKQTRVIDELTAQPAVETKPSKSPVQA